MGDPAVEAAERAERESGWWKDPYSQGWNQEHAVAAAREMAAPIRDLHKPGRWVHSWVASGPVWHDRCPDCLGRAGVHGCGCWADEDVAAYCSCSAPGLQIPWRDCPTARLIYTSSELEER